MRRSRRASRRTSRSSSSAASRSTRRLRSRRCVIRACGTAAFLLLHVVLCIGPLCRLDRRFLPLLYNRRHLGVTTFLLGATHGVFAIVQFHALGDVNPVASVLVTSRGYEHARRLSVPAARAGGTLHLVCDGRHQPRFLAARAVRAGVEDAAHARVRRLRADRGARGARGAPGRTAPRAARAADAGHGARRRAARAGGRARTPGRRGSRASGVRSRPASSTCAPSTTSPTAAPGRCACRANASRCSSTTARCRRFRTCAGIRTGRSARARSSAAASSARGMATNTGPPTDAPHRRSPRSCRRLP